MTDSESKRVRIILDDDVPDVVMMRGGRSQIMKSSDYLDYLSPSDMEMNTVQKRQYVANNTKYLTKEDHIELGRIFEERGGLRYLKENSDGLRANLDHVNDQTTIQLLYACVKYKLAHK